MENNRLSVKRLSSIKEEVPQLLIQKTNVDNVLLRDKTGREILKMLKVDFVNSDIAKGISDMEVSYVPDFGYTDIIKFDDEEKQKSGWKIMLDCIQKIPKYGNFNAIEKLFWNFKANIFCDIIQFDSEVIVL